MKASIHTWTWGYKVRQGFRWGASASIHIENRRKIVITTQSIHPAFANSKFAGNSVKRQLSALIKAIEVLKQNSVNNVTSVTSTSNSEEFNRVLGLFFRYSRLRCTELELPISRDKSFEEPFRALYDLLFIMEDKNEGVIEYVYGDDKDRTNKNYTNFIHKDEMYWT